MFGRPPYGAPPDDVPLTRDSRWFEVVWGVPDCACLHFMSVTSFHPSHAAREVWLRAHHPGVAAWLDREVGGRWRFVRRRALYCNDTRSVYTERLFLFDMPEEGARFVEVQADAILRARLEPQTAWNFEEAAGMVRARAQATRLLALEPRAIVPVLLRQTPPLTSNYERWTQGGTQGYGQQGTMWGRLVTFSEPATSGDNTPGDRGAADTDCARGR